MKKQLFLLLSLISPLATVTEIMCSQNSKKYIQIKFTTESKTGGQILYLGPKSNSSFSKGLNLRQTSRLFNMAKSFALNPGLEELVGKECVKSINQSASRGHELTNLGIALSDFDNLSYHVLMLAARVATATFIMYSVNYHWAVHKNKTISYEAVYGTQEAFLYAWDAWKTGNLTPFRTVQQEDE